MTGSRHIRIFDWLISNRQSKIEIHIGACVAIDEAMSSVHMRVLQGASTTKHSLFGRTRIRVTVPSLDPQAGCKWLPAAPLFAVSSIEVTDGATRTVMGSLQFWATSHAAPLPDVLETSMRDKCSPERQELVFPVRPSTELEDALRKLSDNRELEIVVTTRPPSDLVVRECPSTLPICATFDVRLEPE